MTFSFAIPYWVYEFFFSRNLELLNYANQVIEDFVSLFFQMMKLSSNYEIVYTYFPQKADIQCNFCLAF